MTPEETAAMAKRIEENRKEKAPMKKVKIKDHTPKPVKIKVKVEKEKPVKKATHKAKAKKERIKPIGPATKLFKFKPGTKSRDVCDVLNCRDKPKKGFRCEKHKKIIRKAQLAANNKVWKKRVKEGTAGHHVVYTMPKTGKVVATRHSLKATDKAIAVVKSGHSVIEEVGKFKEIVAKTKKARAA